MVSQALATPLLPPADVVVSASPSFPALLPAIAFTRARRVPWVLWLHDILPDGASATGLVEEGAVLSAARWLERTAYAHATKIVVLSNAFTSNLVRKGVPAEKIRLIYDPATRTPTGPPAASDTDGLRVLSMGNIGFSQGLAALVDVFERDSRMEAIFAQLVITGDGVAAGDVRNVVRSARVKMLGVVDEARLENELRRAHIAFVSQQYEGSEFNIPSKLMNFMAYGLPILAAVNPKGEVARIVADSNAGWVIDSSEPDTFPQKLVDLSRAPQEIAQRGANADDYWREHFTSDAFATAFDELLREIASPPRSQGTLGSDSLQSRRLEAAR